jgi:hypothetical protein
MAEHDQFNNFRLLNDNFNRHQDFNHMQNLGGFDNNHVQLIMPNRNEFFINGVRQLPVEHIPDEYIPVEHLPLEHIPPMPRLVRQIAAGYPVIRRQ